MASECHPSPPGFHSHSNPHPRHSRLWNVRVWILILINVTIQHSAQSFSFVPLQHRRVWCTDKGYGHSLPNNNNKKKSMMKMKDASAANWFQVGDAVQVTESVSRSGVELKGRIGRVVETWEKCDVDPTCCCAEFVDDCFAVRVCFREEDGSHFEHYFAELELVKFQQEEENEKEGGGRGAFDGMSCTAFKLDRLKMGQQAKRIASFESNN